MTFRYFSKAHLDWTNQCGNQHYCSFSNDKDFLYHAMIEVNGAVYSAGGQRYVNTKYVHESEVRNRQRTGDEDLIRERHIRPRYWIESQSDFIQFDRTDLKWKKLPSMCQPRFTFPIIHLNGLIYAIGGLDGSYMEYDDLPEEESFKPIDNVECYNIEEQVWQAKAPLPEKCQNMSAVTFQGKILVQGLVYTSEQVKSMVLVYNPNSDSWQTAMCDEVDIRPGAGAPPVLFVYRGTCYRISYEEYTETEASTETESSTEIESNTNEPLSLSKLKVTQKPKVQALEFVAQHDDTALVAKEDVSQERIPQNEMGAFRISSEVFVNGKGFIYKTGIKIDESSEVSDVDMEKSLKLYSLLSSREHIYLRKGQYSTLYWN